MKTNSRQARARRQLLFRVLVVHQNGQRFASFVMGALLVFTGFDERQNVTVDALQGSIALIKSETAEWPNRNMTEADRIAVVTEQIGRAVATADNLRRHLGERLEKHPDQSEHIDTLLERTDAVRAQAVALQERGASLVNTPSEIVREADAL